MFQWEFRPGLMSNFYDDSHLPESVKIADCGMVSTEDRWSIEESMSGDRSIAVSR